MSTPPSPPSKQPTSPFTLTLTSHGRSFGPLIPPPDITINLTRLPNPPVNLRRQYLGTSRRIQKEFFGIPAVQDALASAVERIGDGMDGVERHDDASIGAMTAATAVVQESDPETPSRTLRVGIQCEMGRHRSVAMTEELARVLGGREGWIVDVLHRDIGGAGGKKGGNKERRRGKRMERGRPPDGDDEREEEGEGGGKALDS